MWNFNSNKLELKLIGRYYLTNFIMFYSGLLNNISLLWIPSFEIFDNVTMKNTDKSTTIKMYPLAPTIRVPSMQVFASFGKYRPKIIYETVLTYHSLKYLQSSFFHTDPLSLSFSLFFNCISFFLVFGWPWKLAVKFRTLTIIKTSISTDLHFSS